RAGWPEGCALEIGRQEAVRPVGRAALGECAFWKHDERGQVLVERAQAVGGPGADGRVAAKTLAGVHLVAGRGVVDRVDLASAVDAKLVSHASEVLEVFA